MTLTSASLPETNPAIVPASIFRAYDIRGIFPDQLNSQSMSLLSRALGSEALAQGIDTLLVGYDGRLSSPELSHCLIEGLLGTGCNVVDLGQIPTPMLYFAAHTTANTSGVMLTASHNPAHYNGLKILFKRTALAANQIQQIHDRVQCRDFDKGTGNYSKYSVAQKYVQNIQSRIHLKKPLKIVIDCANAIAGQFAPTLFRALGCEVDPLFCQLDGNFPNHSPDPTVPANLASLAARVVSTGADLGLAFDGDADRLGLVTNTGEVIAADRLLMLLVHHIAPAYPGSSIVFDVKCSKRLAALIEDAGCIPVMHNSGHSLMKQMMQRSGAPVGGEFAAHFFFKDRWFGFDDGMYAGARLLEILSACDEPASAVFARFSTDVSTPEISVPVPEEHKFALMEEILARADFGNATQITIDGLRVEFANGWGLVRASNTSPALLLRFEAEDAATLVSIQERFKALIRSADTHIKLDF